ncbi:MAG: hypothetical protein ABII90_16145 [Bacteroidota bacterium]
MKFRYVLYLTITNNYFNLPTGRRHLLVYCFIACFLLFITPCFAQNTTTILSDYEDTLKILSPEILQGKEDREKYNANEKFIRTLERALNIENSFDYPFDSLTTIARLIAPDRSFRIFNWNLPKSDGTFEHFGFIQRYDKKSKTHKLYRLNDKSPDIESPELQVLDNDNWYGAHYYKIILKKRSGKKYYTLLGWDGNDRVTTKKIIDVICFTRNGKLQFGSPIFKMGKTVKKRVIFEYSSQVVISTKYFKDSKMIIFDHLSPSNPELKGQHQFYGPDGSYDALVFKKGKWELLEDIDARNKRESSKDILQKYNKPK